MGQAQAAMQQGKGLFLHTINSDSLLNNLVGMTTQLPTKIEVGVIVYRTSIRDEDRYLGPKEVLVFESLSEGMSPEEWRSPGDGSIIDGGLIALSECLRIKKCDCLDGLLRKHFRDSGLPRKPEPLQERGGVPIAFKLTKARQRP